VTRRRRTRQQARDEILAAARQRLIAGGPSAVRVQLVARDVGVTDAAVHHHFGNREGLVREALRGAARGLADQIAGVVARWRPDRLALDELLATLASAYRDDGLARMTAWLVIDGWIPRGRGMFRPIADTLARARRAGRPRSAGSSRGAKGAKAPQGSDRDDARFAALLLNQVAWTEAFAGELFHRAVGFPDDAKVAARYQRWLARLMTRTITGEPDEPGTPPAHDAEPAARRRRAPPAASPPRPRRR
jgi:AcrR family transcriptional regulator